MLTGSADVFISCGKNGKNVWNPKISRDFPKKLKGGSPMLYLFLSALRAVLYEVAVCLLRGVCRA